MYDCAQACAALHAWAGATGLRTAPSPTTGPTAPGARRPLLINDHYEDVNGNLQIRSTGRERRFLNCIMWGNNAGARRISMNWSSIIEGNDNDLLIRGCAVDMDEART